MAADKGISDDELRRRLQGYGEDVPPVTAQTRPYLLRKLKRFDQGSQTTKQTKKTPQKSAKKSESFNPRRSSTPSRRLIGFSSDEETESEAAPSKRSKISPGRGRRSEAIKSPPAESERSMELSRRPIKLIADSSNENSLSNSFGNASLEKTSVLPGVSKAYQRRSIIAVDETDSGSSRKYRFAPWNSERGSQQRRDMQAGGLLHFEQAKRLSSDIVNIVSVIVAIVCIVILFAYALQSPSFVVTSQVRLPLCVERAVTNEKKPKDCIKLDDAANIYIDYLYDVLTHKKGAIECQDGDGDGKMTNSSISVDVLRTRIRQDNENRNPKDQEKILNKILEQIRNNSHWQIKIYRIKDEEVLESEVAIKSISCRIKEALSRIAMRVILVVVVLCCLLAFYYFVRNRWRREEEETRLMYHFVEKILDILHNHHLECKKDKDLIPYLPIPHVRDMIIAPVDRQNLLKVWNKAVRFLSANESRVRVESQRIAGEDFEVWRWIQTTGQRHQQHHKMSLSASLKTKQGKVWQGQAFENFQSAVNPPIISPTPCLKIRNMFDPDVEANENWHVVIQDAILEKCSENNASVVHIAVDKSSSEGCVYVKCDTHASAGFAFRSLHGCWFDGRLVAVKYLTLKRYHQRFPMALEATVPLRPSGTTPSSLVTFNPETEDDVEPEVNDSDFEA